MPANLPCPVAHSETANLEHSDRMSRLLRLANEDVQPSFEVDYLLPEEHGQGDFPMDLPVLRVTFDTDVFFDTAKSEIRPEAFPVLRIISESLDREPADVALYIVGHTDSRGGEDYNYNLGLARADAVARAIARRRTSFKADVYRLSLGELYPVASNTTPEGRARNRRVEFMFGATAKTVQTLVEKIAVQPCVARDADGVATCKRAVQISVQKVEIDPQAARLALELNREEEALELRAMSENVSDEELNRERAEIELKRQRIAIVPDRPRVAVLPVRNGGVVVPATQKPGVVPR